MRHRTIEPPTDQQSVLLDRIAERLHDDSSLVLSDVDAETLGIFSGSGTFGSTRQPIVTGSVRGSSVRQSLYRYGDALLSVEIHHNQQGDRRTVPLAKHVGRDRDEWSVDAREFDVDAAFDSFSRAEQRHLTNSEMKQIRNEYVEGSVLVFDRVYDGDGVYAALWDGDTIWMSVEDVYREAFKRVPDDTISRESVRDALTAGRPDAPSRAYDWPHAGEYAVTVTFS